MKRCWRCRKKKSIACFSKNQSKKDGHCDECKICAAKYLASFHKKNPNYEKDYGLKREYGFGLSTYNKMLKKQSYMCAICKKKTSLDVDHDHKTNKIRGLLCPNCNKGLGFLNDSILNLESAIAYLKGQKGKI